MNIECTDKTFYMAAEMQRDELDQTILLFEEKEQQVIKNMIKNLQIDDPMYTHLTKRISITLYLTKSLQYRLYVWCDREYIHELIQVFADEDIKNKIRRKAFEYV